MKTVEAKEVYKQGASAVEWVTAQARGQGLARPLVRGWGG
jgi:hypothetical protein